MTQITWLYGYLHQLLLTVFQKYFVFCRNSREWINRRWNNRRWFSIIDNCCLLVEGEFVLQAAMEQQFVLLAPVSAHVTEQHMHGHLLNKYYMSAEHQKQPRQPNVSLLYTKSCLEIMDELDEQYDQCGFGLPQHGLHLLQPEPW